MRCALKDFVKKRVLRSSNTGTSLGSIFLAVIARLDRAIQYSRAFKITHAGGYWMPRLRAA